MNATQFLHWKPCLVAMMSSWDTSFLISGVLLGITPEISESFHYTITQVSPNSSHFFPHSFSIPSISLAYLIFSVPVFTEPQSTKKSILFSLKERPMCSPLGPSLLLFGGGSTEYGLVIIYLMCCFMSILKTCFHLCSGTMITLLALPGLALDLICFSTDLPCLKAAVFWPLLTFFWSSGFSAPPTLNWPLFPTLAPHGWVVGGGGGCWVVKGSSYQPHLRPWNPQIKNTRSDLLL